MEIHRHQRINPQDDDYRRISSYLGKQTNLALIALDPFNSDLSQQKNEKTSTHDYLPRGRSNPSGTAAAEKKPLPEYLSFLQRGDCREVRATGLQEALK